MIEKQPKPPFLIVEQTGQIFSLDQELVSIGRKSGNTIVLGDDIKASRHHATIVLEGEQYILRDAGSSNGTFVNNDRLTEPYILKSGDVFQIGDTTFKVRLPLDDTEPIISLPSLAPASPAADAPGRQSTTEMTILRSTAELNISENPYVGPRTFAQEEADRFFGREVEARELYSLVISQRLVLFYAQSGAGKSSLINTRLVPQLREGGFPVLPIARVSGELPAGISDVGNIYLFNLLLSMDESDGEPQRFTHMSLTDFLKHLTSLDGQHYYYDDTPDDEGVYDEQFETNEFDSEEPFYEETPYVLIIDQFEEIVTTHADHWQDRERFFKQLAEAMADDPLLWVVLTLREDYIAPLDPYMHLLPDKMRARFYMQRMKYEAALEAVKKPAEKYGRPFASGAAENLVNNLRQIRSQMTTQSPDGTATKLGEFIEPVQLQVVCYQLWENLKERPLGEISQQDLVELGDVDAALAQFYEQALDKVISQTSVSEIELRNWFETKLITESGTRGTVYRGLEQTGDIPNEAVDLLANYFLLRSEVRTGGTWYELVHDRFVAPIQQANQAWRVEQPLIQMAQAWIDSDKNTSKLLEGQQLALALESNWSGLGETVEEFIEVSQNAQQLKDEDRRQQELEQAQALAEEQRKRAELQAEATAKLRQRAWWLGMLVFFAILMAGAAIVVGFVARDQADQATASEATAVSALSTAQADATAAQVNAEAARDILDGQKASATVVAAAMVDEGNKEATSLAITVQNLEATVTAAQASLQIPATEVEVIPTITSEITTYTPQVAASDTLEPTFTPTPTPNLAATQMAEAEATAVAEELAAVYAQQTRIAEQAVSSSRTCEVEPQGEFGGIWQRFRDRLGCPFQHDAIGGSFAEQGFEHGFMIWTQILDQFFVAVGDGQRGEWQLYERTDFVKDAAGCEPSIEKSRPDLIQPVSGFGGIWCTYPELQEEIGYGVAPEAGVPNNLIQEFERGYIIQTAMGHIYALFDDDETYLRAN